MAHQLCGQATRPSHLRRGVFWTACLFAGILTTHAVAEVDSGDTGDTATGPEPTLVAVAETAEATTTFSYLRQARQQSGGARLELAGLFINRREQPAGLTLLVEADGTRLLPLDELAPMLGIEHGREREAITLDSPLGRTELSLDEVVRRGDALFVAPEVLAERLAARIEWNDAELAYFIQLLWDPRWSARADEKLPLIEPDTRAPGFSLSRFRGEVSVEHDDRDTRERAFTELSGRAGRGTWQGRYTRDTGGADRVTDYHWQTRTNGSAFLLGHQVVSGHNLLSGFNLTGAQAAWSNQPERLISPLGSQRLVEDSSSPIRTFRGFGPPGGIAELRINGRVRERQRIRLDGEFEFLDVQVPAGFVEIQIDLYEPFALGAPVETLDFSTRASQRLLHPGATRVFAAAGLEGNPLDDRVEDRDGAALINIRQALGRNLTLEAAAQTSEDGDQAAVGVVVNLHRLGIASLSAARSNGASATLLTLDGDWNRAFWRLSLRDREAGFRPGINVDERDHFAEAGFRYWPWWEVSLIARERFGPGQDVDYIKPAARLRPMPGLTLQSRPDSLGDYVHDLNWTIDRDTRFRARQDSSLRQASLDRRWSRQWTSTASLARDRNTDRWRAGLGSRWQSLDPFGWFVDASLLYSEGDGGFALETGRELIPGLRFLASARRDPLYERSLQERGTIFRAVLSWDFGVSRAGLTRFGGTRSGLGTVGGRIQGAPDRLDLSGIGVRVNGQMRGRTDSAGRFNIGGLAPGVYRVELDEEAMPLELSSLNQRYQVEIAAGATTSVDFGVELLLGAAGRLTDTAGVPLPDLTVELVDGDGALRGSGVSNRFGFWRVDGLPPGRYRARVVIQDSIVAGRIVTLKQDFLFGQDMQIDAKAISPLRPGEKP